MNGPVISSKDRLIKLHEVMNRLGIGRSSVYKLVKLGSLPPPLYPSRNQRCWLESEINGFIEKLVRERPAIERETPVTSLRELARRGLGNPDDFYNDGEIINGKRR
jgi:prophage regulatory protein